MAKADTDRQWVWPFVAGLVVGGTGLVIAQALKPRRGLDPRLVARSPETLDVPPAVLVPGILGSELVRPDGTQVWLNLGNAFGTHDLALPLRLPLSQSRDDLEPAGLLGVDTMLPRLFGFTEYSDVLDLLEGAGFRRMGEADSGPIFHIFTYDWRRDLVESARRLHETLESIAHARGEPDLRFNVIGHSMGGLVCRYYLRYGTAEPSENATVTWAGARRIRNLILVAVPNGGSIPSFDAILNGNRVGFSHTTLASTVIARMPSIYQLLPPAGTKALIDERLAPLDEDLHDPATWERHGWGPFVPAHRRAADVHGSDQDLAMHRDFVSACLARARTLHHALNRKAQAPCPARVVILGGDCLPTLTRALVPDTPGTPPRFEAWSEQEAAAMFEAGDGRVPRSSVVCSHLPGADDDPQGCGLPEVSQAFFGDADHHGIYDEPTFQSILLRMLLRPLRRAAPPGPRPARS